MFLVNMHCFAENTDIPCVVAKTEKEAHEWITKEMEGKKYSGGCHQVVPIELYKSNYCKEKDFFGQSYDIANKECGYGLCNNCKFK